MVAAFMNDRVTATKIALKIQDIGPQLFLSGKSTFIAKYFQAKYFI
jgi:hypothetical protein